MINESRIVPYAASELPVDSGPWLVFAPHADDESFGMGGTIAKAVAAGIKVVPVIMTNGELGGSAGTPENLIAIRKQEACEAAEVLGMESPQFLGIDDRGVQLHETFVTQILETLTQAQPAAVFFPGPFELHPDHRATAGLVWQALSLLDAPGPIPVSYEVLVQSPVNCLVDISAYIDRKKAAMAAYRSQLAEHRYEEIALAMNTLRTLTLAPEVTFAEGFYRYPPNAVQKKLWEFISGEVSPYFDP